MNHIASDFGPIARCAGRDVKHGPPLIIFTDVMDRRAPDIVPDPIGELCMSDADETLIGRLARFLAAAYPGPADMDRAASILAIIKEPDAKMLSAGSGEVWRKMIDAALSARWDVVESLGDDDPAGSGGTDEEGEIRLTQKSARADGASWVQPENDS